MNPNFESLREWLIRYYGIASVNGYPQATVELAEVETCDTDKLIEHAKKLNLNLEDFCIE